MKKNFGYACSEIIKQLKLKSLSSGEGCTLKDLKIYFKSGEGGYLDSINYNSSLKEFTGANIACILELVTYIRWGYYTLEDVNTLLKSDIITNNFKRIMMYNLYQEYISIEYDKYMMLKASVKDLLS